MGVAQQLDPEANRITGEAQTENFLVSRRISIRWTIGFSHTTVAGVIECLIWAKGFVLRTYLLLDITSSVRNMCLVSSGRESVHKNYLHKEAHATDRTFGKKYRYRFICAIDSGSVKSFVRIRATGYETKYYTR